MQIATHTFSNGLRLLHQHVRGSRISHIALTANVGTRDEIGPANNGIAHFTEHMLFKGTRKRSARQVITYLDVVGGDVNAYTTKEKVCIHASFTRQYTRRALDLLIDQFFFSTFPEKELKKEKSVVIDEIHNYEDNPDEQIYDQFEERIFAGSTLGTNILGTEESVANFSQQQLIDFHRTFFTAQNSVISYSGNLSLSSFVAMAEAFLNDIPQGTPPARTAAPIAPVFKYVEQKQTVQVYANWGGFAYPADHELRIPMLFLTNILGGDQLNAKLNLNIRERVGLVYHIEAQYNPFIDTGLFNIFYSTDPKNAARLEKLVEKELLKLCAEPLSEKVLSRFKKQFKSRILMGEENRQSLIIALAKTWLDFNKMDDLESVFKRIDAITPEELHRCANECMHPSKLSRLTFIPESE